MYCRCKIKLQINQISIGQCNKISLHEGSIVNSKDYNGCTPLHWACAVGTKGKIMEKQIEIIALLIKYKADLNILSKNSETPLHMASKFGRTDAVKLLMNEYHQSARKMNNKFQTPFDLAGCPIAGIFHHEVRMLQTKKQRSNKESNHKCRSFF